MATNFDEQLAEMTESNLGDIEQTADSVEEAQWASACSVVHTEEERIAVLNAGKKVKYSFPREGTTFTLIRTVTEEPLIMDLITQGKDTPYTKGKGNPVEQLDGSTEPSKSITQGTPLPWLAWNAVSIEEDTQRILGDIIPQRFQSAVSQASQQFGETVIRPWLSHQIIGGES